MHTIAGTFTVSLELRAVLCKAAQLCAIVQVQVDHASDGVRAVLRSSTLTQHVNGLQGRVGDLVKVRRLERATVAGVHHHGRTMHTLSVEQHQSLIRRQIAKARRAHKNGGVQRRQGLNAKRGNEAGQCFHQLFRRCRLNHALGYHIDGFEALSGCARGSARTGNGHLRRVIRCWHLGQNQRRHTGRYYQAHQTN